MRRRENPGVFPCAIDASSGCVLPLGLMTSAHPADAARVESRQMPIFPRECRAVCAELELSARELRRLRDEEWLSFDPERGGPLDESREAELVFLGSLVRAGLSRAVIRGLLGALGQPFCYDIRRMYYAWCAREWRMLPGEQDPEGTFFALLDRLRERNARPALLNLRAWLDEALDLARERSHLFTHSSRLPAPPRDSEPDRE